MSARLNGTVIAVMAKAPVAGQVKTRLARAIGDTEAVGLYRAFLHDIARRFESPDWTLVWMITPPDTDLHDAIGRPCLTINQRGEGLAERMHNAVTDLLHNGATRVVLLGADAPHLEPATIHRCIAALNRNDAAFVPTHDGGYCLVALARDIDLFTPVPMSSRDTWTASQIHAAANGWRLHIEPPTFDIDEPADIDLLRAWLSTHPGELPATERALQDVVA